jgi:adenylate kinase family enzyme
MSKAIRRIAVVGPNGCGKTTLARSLSERIGVRYVELDLFRYDPGWTEVSDDLFWNRVAEQVGADQWVIDGNYGAVRDIIWIRAEVLVWMDYALPVVVWRLLSRTVRRVLSGEEFANGNRERLSRLFSRQSILLWTIRSHRPRRRLYEELLATPRYAHLRVVRFRSPSAAASWLSQFPVAANAGEEPRVRME